MPDEFRSAISAAMNSNHADDVIEGVKSAVISEFERLDPSVVIRSTDYFNHSFAPDLVLKWGTKEYREVYLRYNLRSTSAGRDVELLSTGAPVLFSLDSGSDDDDDDVTTELSEEVRRSPGTLVTNAPALESIVDEVPSASRIQESANEQRPPENHPLFTLFKKNIVRGGRGLVVENTASRFRPPPSGATDETEINYAANFADMADEVLREDAALQVRRASDLIRVALTGDIGLLELQAPESMDITELDVPSGRLTQDEIRALIPYLLRKSRASIDSRFWSHIGSMITLRQLEEMAGILDGADISDFVRANMANWRARRSALVINSDSIEADAPVTPAWTFRSKMVCATAGSWTAFFAWDKRKGGSSREDSLLADWDSVRPSLSSLSLSGIELQGVVRAVKLTADENFNLLADATQIQSSINDEFRVRSVDIRTSVDDSSDIHLDFSTMTGAGRDVPLSDLAVSTFSVLGHRFPLLDSEFEVVATPTETES